MVMKLGDSNDRKSSAKTLRVKSIPNKKHTLGGTGAKIDWYGMLVDDHA